MLEQNKRGKQKKQKKWSIRSRKLCLYLLITKLDGGSSSTGSTNGNSNYGAGIMPEERYPSNAGGNAKGVASASLTEEQVQKFKF